MITATHFIPTYAKVTKGGSMFKGYRTYLSALAIAVAAGLHYLGYINDTLYQSLLGVLGAGSIAALRAAK